MSILQNAIDSISLGLEDYKSPDPRRLVSATRNIYAGILLLFKCKLSDMSPAGSDDVLLKELVFPTATSTGDILWKGRGKKTVDVARIHERFDGLGIAIDWKRLDEINEYRNNIEHYFSSLSKKAVSDIIAKSFLIIRDFLVAHLELDPRSTLGEAAWQTLVEVNDVYLREREECTASVENIDWHSDMLEASLLDFKCDQCGSDLIFATSPTADRDSTTFECRSCGRKWTFDYIVEPAIHNYCGWRDHMAIKDGGEVASTQCPRCFKETYILEEQQCAACLETLEHTCQRCGNEIPPEELFLDNGYCGWCDHMMSKDD